MIEQHSQQLLLCARCDRMVFAGLLVRVPVLDLPLLHPDRVIVKCSDCGSCWVRPDGAL